MAFNCVERVKFYATQLPSEKPRRTREVHLPWPQRGVLEARAA